jgi:non-specific serine/threonine protein kinase
LEQQLPLIDSSPRDAPARQRTVRDTISWSYELLAPDEQTLMRRLSIFKGGWTIDAAEAVVGGVAGAGRIDVLQGLATLVEHSLIDVHAWFDGSPRFSMLNTIRAFSLDRLEHDEERNATGRRHAAYFVWLFTGSERDQHTKRAEIWLQRGAAEIENVRLALAWAVIHDPETALRLAREMSWIWFMHGATPESQTWLERALACAGDIPDDLRAGVLMWIGANATVLGDYGKAWAAHEEAIAINRTLGHTFGVARNLHGLGRIATFTGDAEQAAALYESAADILRDQHDPALIVTLSNLGGVLLTSGKLEQAVVVLDEALAYAERDGLPWHIAQILDAQGRVALARGNLSDAHRALRRCLQLNRDAQDPRFVAQALETCIWLAAIEGMAEHAARLLGAVSRIRETIGVPVPPSIQANYDRYVPIAQAQLSNAAWQAALAQGQTLSQAEAIEAALQGLA